MISRVHNISTKGFLYYELVIMLNIRELSTDITSKVFYCNTLIEHSYEKIIAYWESLAKEKIRHSVHKQTFTNLVI